MKKLLFLFCIILSNNIYAQNARPIVSNINFSDSAGILKIYYDVSDVENDSLEIFITIKSVNKPIHYDYRFNTLGDIGKGISPGQNKMIQWLYGNQSINDSLNISIYADDHKTVSITDLLTLVDTNRMKRDMDSLEGTRHFSAAPLRLAKIKDTISNRYVNYGYKLREQQFQYGSYAAKNIEGSKLGRGKEDEYYIIDAHFDCVSNGPGADDNLSAVVAMLEASRILKSVELNRSIKFVGFDLEELGLLGSKEYVKNFLPNYQNIVGVYNFEMIGYYSNRKNSQTLPAGFSLLFPEAFNEVVADTFKGNFITNVSNSRLLAEAFESIALTYVPNLKVISVVVLNNGNIVPDLRRSDHAPFWDAGYPALMLTDGANFRNKNYHTANDVSDSLNFQFMSNVLKATLASVLEGAGLSHAGLASKEVYIINAVGIETQNKVKELLVQPNPAINQCKIEWPINFEAKEIKVYDSKAELVYSSKLYSNSSHILLTDVYAEGHYFVEIVSSKAQMRSRFVVKR